LRFHELEKTLAIAAHVALDFRQRRQVFAFGLGYVENVNSTKSVELSRIAFRVSGIRATGQLVDPRSAVIHQARQLNREYGFFASRSQPFERLTILASLQGVEIHEMDRRLASREKKDAILMPTSGGKRLKGQILYNPTRPPGRVAFSVAHEIAHTFFPNSVSGARFRTMCNPDSREGNELERPCDLAASELLMPRPVRLWGFI
jgi:hypothetical protein